ncbi:hypothetical protein Y032_0533g3047 [Ancylostoma ceylanicum]|uniref:Uncharacterized protein n=1 Tax=Ancylostoma ceylanicum TaxID=53326 RepID=A0A016WTK4_9BILA|nr:hypothetical protein Y032_0533g3047 [Ancylostoma ceylanicum]
MWDALRNRLHLSIVEALDAYVPYKVTCGEHPICQDSDSSPQSPLVPIYRPRGWMGWLAKGAIEPSTVCVGSEPLTTAQSASLIWAS